MCTKFTNSRYLATFPTVWPGNEATQWPGCEDNSPLKMGKFCLCMLCTALECEISFAIIVHL